MRTKPNGQMAKPNGQMAGGLNLLVYTMLQKSTIGIILMISIGDHLPRLDKPKSLVTSQHPIVQTQRR